MDQTLLLVCIPQDIAVLVAQLVVVGKLEDKHIPVAVQHIQVADFADTMQYQSLQ
jgi:hypothetical protein